jgi:hypothetical protein
MTCRDRTIFGTLHQLIIVFLYDLVKTIGRTGHQETAYNQHSPVHPVNMTVILRIGFTADQKSNRSRENDKKCQPEFDQL